MRLPERVERKIKEIEEDRERGASELIFEIIEAFRLLLSEGFNRRDLIIETAGRLSKARPSISPIKNHAERIAKSLGKILSSEEAFSFLEDYRKKMKRRDEEVLNNAEFLKHFSLITCSYSSLVKKFLQRLTPENTLKEVLVLESRLGGMGYGRKYLDIPIVSIVPDDEIENGVKRVDAGLIGADSVAGDGFVINGTPSLKLAMALHSLQKPLYVITGLDKWTEKTAHVEDGFDLIPSHLVKAFITEEGVLSFEEFSKRASSLF